MYVLKTQALRNTSNITRAGNNVDCAIHSSEVQEYKKTTKAEAYDLTETPWHDLQGCSGSDLLILNSVGLLWLLRDLGQSLWWPLHTCTSMEENNGSHSSCHYLHRSVPAWIFSLYCADKEAGIFIFFFVEWVAFSWNFQEGALKIWSSSRKKSSGNELFSCCTFSYHVPQVYRHLDLYF